MKSIKRSLQESRLNTHRLIRAWLQPRLGEVGNRFRLGGRIRLANRWARKHPRRCVPGRRHGCLRAKGAAGGKHRRGCPADGQPGNGRSSVDRHGKPERHRTGGTDVSGIPSHTGKQERAPYHADGTDRPGTGTAGGTGFAHRPSP